MKLVKAFAEKARNDLDSAMTLLNSGDYSNASYLAQQAGEKITKTVLILNKKFERTHLVSGLLGEVTKSLPDEWKTKLQELVPLMENLEKNWVLPRYPEPSGEEVWNPVEEYEAGDAKDAIGKAEKVLKTITEFIKEYYEIEL